MTTTTPATLVATGTTETPRVGFASLMLAEWTKLRSVRSTLWTLLLLVVLSIGLTTLITSLTVASWTQSTNSARLAIQVDPVGFIVGTGLEFGQIPICVLGVLVIASEYSTGVIRSSLLAVPRRTPMLWAKCVVFGLVAFVVSEATVFPAFFIGAAIMHSRVHVSLADPGVLRSVIGAGLYVAVLGLFSLAIGGIIRHTAGAIVAVLAFVLVLAPLATLLPGSVGNHIHYYLPTVAGQLIASVHRANGQVLSAWEGFGVFCLWTAALLAVGAYLLRTRDA